MSEVIQITCPQCGSEKCLLGRLEPNDSDTNYDGKFYPLYIQQSWLITQHLCIEIQEHDSFKACTECGHLWSSVNPVIFRKRLEKHNWNGQKQIKPPKRRSYFGIVSFSIILTFILAILYFKHA